MINLRVFSIPRLLYVIFEYCLEKKSFLSEWKNEDVVHAFKEGDK